MVADSIERMDQREESQSEPGTTERGDAGEETPEPFVLKEDQFETRNEGEAKTWEEEDTRPDAVRKRGVKLYTGVKAEPGVPQEVGPKGQNAPKGDARQDAERGRRTG